MNPDTLSLEAAIQLANRVSVELAQAVVGQKGVIEQVLLTLLAGGHALIEGAPGLGKTLLVHAMAKAFSCTYARVQFTPDLMPADVAGHSIYDMQSGQFRVRQGPIFTNLLLADEINRAPAKTQSALLEVMQEHQVTIDGQTLKLSEPFMVLATQNPLEQEGTYPLPEAQLDRFLLKILIHYPDAAEEKMIVKKVTSFERGDALNVADVKTVINASQVILLQQAVTQITTDDRIIDYAVRIARQTRSWTGISVGAGPRGAISLVRAAKSMALIKQRDFVLPDDIKQVALPALRHRVTLAPEMEIEGQTSDTVINALLNHVEAPRT